MSTRLDALVIRHTHRVPAPQGPPGTAASTTGATAARQFDAVLMTAGFKLSRELLAHLSGLTEGTVIDTAVRVLPVVREMVGDHVEHNVYFRDFPRNVPDTVDFWMRCIAEAMVDDDAMAALAESAHTGVLNLLTLPAYGRYQHTYAEMLDAHAELIAAAGDRVTVLHLGGDLAEEETGLYLALAGSVTPLGEDGLAALDELAGRCAGGPQPETIPVRENRAVVNRARLQAGAPLLVDTVTDVLRLACAMSDGDVTLLEPTRFTAMPRPARRALLAALDGVVAADPAKLGDVAAYRERWKRLGERLHPHEYPRWPQAARVFAVARGEQAAPSIAGRVEARFAADDVIGAANVLKASPGMLFRSLDRLLRSATPAEQDAILGAAEEVAGRVAGRVVLSVREHLLNRAAAPGRARVFADRLGRGRIEPDTRPPLAPEVLERLAGLLDAEVRRRLPAVEHLVVDPAVLDVALPLSGKAAGTGFGVLPRGSVTPVDGDLLRFFVHWRQRERDTDFDLSALTLNERYHSMAWLSYTQLTMVSGEHSGDITEAPDGASEFIDLRLAQVREPFIVPQVNIYDGEGFEEVRESFFGFMLRGAEQQGRPFEARTVRMKSDLRGPGRVALPLIFMRGDDGRWRAKWLHMFLKGEAMFNRVETNRLTTAALVRAVVERRYLTLRYLVERLAPGTVTRWDGGRLPDGPVTFIGAARPEGLPVGSRVFTPGNLRDLVPA
ncbi:TerD family protein [Actinomadura macrotermitis]|uniref:TerD family protein n=1 Tax=Actinomadura macrotermitis TaxID=2585200 RepID=A0A7K0C7G0_9ACTN|nr:TerD family protein [Actinomadura macrotermitis]MQY09373.1 hypothetical protein [Actinomadura macrotermitis]